MTWNPKEPLNNLPGHLADIWREEAEYLLGDLQENQVSIICVPAPDPKFSGHKIRVVGSDNPGWYSSLYWSRGVRRQETLRALERIVDGEDNGNKHDGILREMIYDRLTEGYEDQGQFIPPLNIVRAYFGKPDYQATIEAAETLPF